MADLSSTPGAIYTSVQVMMELAAIAYSTDVTAYLGQVQYATQEWQLAWGPATTEDQANLVYIARNASANQFAVVVRGTYPEFGPGMLIQLYQDLGVGTLVPWSYPPTPNAMIAGGTDGALGVITNLASGGVSLKTFLETQALPTSADIYVTGHSLGGCLVTVLAPWLLDQLRPAGYVGVIRPYTYAAPTAGNTTFAAWFDSTFPNGPGTGACRVFNRLDIVPMAWNNIVAIKSLYTSSGAVGPEAVNLVVDLLAGSVATLAYDQPHGGGVELSGASTSSGDFFAEAVSNHAYNTYLSLLQAPVLPFTVGTTRVTWNVNAITGLRTQIGIHGPLPVLPR